MKNKLKVIDVREFEEFVNIPPKDEALCLPMSRYDTWKDSLDKDFEYKTICHTNNRSREVARQMRLDGFDCTNISNGMSELTGGSDCEACNIFTGVCTRK